MRLLDAEALIYDDVAELVEFTDESSAPPYAILSHTWEQEEVLFADLPLGPHHEIRPTMAMIRAQRRGRTMLSADPEEGSSDRYPDEVGQGHVKAGWSKVLNACLQTLRDGLQYVWIDTCKSYV